MKIFYITILSPLILSLFILSCSNGDNPVASEEKTFDAATIAKLETALDESLRELNVPGVILGVWSPQGNYIRAKGVSNLSTGEPMRVDNHFRIASISKTFVGSVVLMLVDEGKISLDKTLSNYLPQYKFASAEKITIRMLGNMTSGIYNYSNDIDFVKDCINNNFNTTYSADSLVKISLKHPMNFEPGTKWEYSNTNTVLLGKICEKVTGKPIYKLLEEKIFIPQGLKDTYWPQNVYLVSPYSHGYTRLNFEKELKDATNYNASWGDAAGILISNIFDLKKWLKILSSGSLYSTAMHTERLKSALGSDNSYGYAISKIGDLMYGHEGAIWGYNSWAYYMPSKDLTIVITVNFYGGDLTNPVEGVAEKILKIVTPELFNSSQSIINSNKINELNNSSALLK